MTIMMRRDCCNGAIVIVVKQKLFYFNTQVYKKGFSNQASVSGQGKMCSCAGKKRGAADDDDFWGEVMK